MSGKTISAEEFDRMFDDGEDIDEYLDWSSLRRPGLEPKRVNVDFPQWMVDRMDSEAKRRGVTRQALIKMWLADKLDLIETAKKKSDLGASVSRQAEAEVPLDKAA